MITYTQLYMKGYIMNTQEIFRCDGVSMSEQFDGEGNGRIYLYAPKFSLTEEYNSFADRKIALTMMLRLATSELERAE